MLQDILHFLTGLWDKYDQPIIGGCLAVLKAILIAVGGKILIGIARKVINKARTGKLQMDDTLAALLKLLFDYGILIICLIMILDAFGVNTTSLIAILGAAGVAVGLALKDTLANIAAGIILLFLRLYRRGDYIEFAGTSGTVREIDLFTTILETPDGIYISAPNSAIWGVPLKNYSRNGRRRMDITLGISYDDSVDAGVRLLQSIADSEKRFMTDPKPQVVVQALADSSVNVQLRAWATGDVYWTVYWDIMRGLKDKASAAGLHIPYPQRDIHLIPPPPPDLTEDQKEEEHRE